MLRWSRIRRRDRRGARSGAAEEPAVLGPALRAMSPPAGQHPDRGPRRLAGRGERPRTRAPSICPSFGSPRVASACISCIMTRSIQRVLVGQPAPPQRGAPMVAVRRALHRRCSSRGAMMVREADAAPIPPSARTRARPAGGSSRRERGAVQVDTAVSHSSPAIASRYAEVDFGQHLRVDGEGGPLPRRGAGAPRIAAKRRRGAAGRPDALFPRRTPARRAQRRRSRLAPRTPATARNAQRGQGFRCVPDGFGRPVPPTWMASSSQHPQFELGGLPGGGGTVQAAMR